MVEGEESRDWTALVDLCSDGPGNHYQLVVAVTRSDIAPAEPEHALSHSAPRLIRTQSFQLPEPEPRPHVGRIIDFYLGEQPNENRDNTTSLSITATFAAYGFVDPTTAEIDWGEGRGWEPLPPGTATAEHTFRNRGLKHVNFRLTDRTGTTEQLGKGIEITTAPSAQY